MTSRLHLRLALLATAISPQFACAQRPSGGSEGAISEALIRRHVNVIADDSMLGRNTPSRGLDLTANYIAAQFKRLGLKPGGDSGSFIQRYPLGMAPMGGANGGSPPTPLGFDPLSAPNSVGILRGTDPALRDQYIVVSAHMDHVGVNGASVKDSIWNGADDDASGTAGVLALAEALAKAPPRRSIIFLTVSGEEHGLWGSSWFTSHPPVPVDRIVANLNLDMIGRNWKDSIVVIGLEHSDLGGTLAKVNAAHPELGITAMRDPWPQENFFGRSDHYNFARRGIPALFFFNGVHADYHQPSDSPEKIDAEKESRVVRLIYHMAVAVANAPARPQWNPESYKKMVR
ncbi:MAG TPA: M28 family peptidase [Gemmatimonadaceae bacterium]